MAATLPQTTPGAFDAAFATASDQVERYLDRLHRKHPAAGPEGFHAIVTRDFRRWVAASSAACGALALSSPKIAAPLGVGVLSLGSFLTASCLYGLALAEVHGIDRFDIPLRRSLIQHALFGDGQPQLIDQEIGAVEPSWSMALTARSPILHARVAGLIVRRRAAKTSASGAAGASGAAAASAIAAVVAALGTRVMASRVINDFAEAFGPLAASSDTDSSLGNDLD